MARLATSQRASELFERMRGVGLGSQTHGLSGVHHIQVRAQAARVHLVNAGVVAVYQCCVWDATLGDAKLVKRPELARSLVLNAAADSHSRLREPLHRRAVDGAIALVVSDMYMYARLSRKKGPQAKTYRA